MSLEQLLSMLGVTSVAEAMTAINRFNMLVEGVMESTGADSAAEALTRFKQLRGSMSAIEQAVGATGGEALARVEAFKAQAAQAKELETQLSGLTKAAEKKAAEEKIGTAISEGRLLPAMRGKAEELYAQNGLGVLETFLAAFPAPFNPPKKKQDDGVKPPKLSADPQGGDDEFSEEEREVMKIMNRTPEQMRASKKLWNESLMRDGKTAVVPESHLREINKKIEQGARS